jgi:hypothetical protein
VLRLAGIGWVLRTLQTRSLGLRWSKFDLIIVLSLLWTSLRLYFPKNLASASRKLRRRGAFSLFTLARATSRDDRRLICGAVDVSASAGALYSAFRSVTRARSVVESIARQSVSTGWNQPGDTIWQINRTASIRQRHRSNVLNSAEHAVCGGIISQGEQVERLVHARAAVSFRIVGTERNHLFRAPAGRATTRRLPS